MRWLVLVVVVICGAREAYASCSGCCHLGVELIGWSKDGRTIAIKEAMGEQPQIVILRDGVETARYGGAAGDGCGLVDPKPAMPAGTFARLAIEPLRSAWRDAFKRRFQIKASAAPYMLDRARCTGTDVVDADGKVAARWVRECDPNETDCIRGTVLGGYVHPSNKWMLVKGKTSSCGSRSSEAFMLVRLDS